MLPSLSASFRVAILAVALAPGLARADDKADCFDAAEKAQKLRNDKKITSARPVLLTCSRDICPQQVRQDCVKWLTEVDNAMSTVVVRARDSNGHDIIDVRVLVDGNVLLPKLEGTSVAVDPGQHKFRYEFPNGKVVEEDVLIAEGEKDRVIRVELKDSGPSGPPSGGEGGGEKSSKGGGPGVAPWIILGVGAASTIAFVALQADAQSTYSSLNNGCGVTHSCDPGKVSALGTEFGVSGVFLAVGATGIVVGATWLIVAAVTGHHTSSSGSFGVTPIVGAAGNGALATFSRSF